MTGDEPRLPILTHPDFPNKNLVDWGAYKQQTCISHSSGGWETKINVCGEGALWGLLFEGTSPVCKGPALMASSHPVTSTS